MQSKSDIRKSLSSVRAAISNADRAQMSVAVCENLRNLDELEKVGRVHAFWPLHEKQEVDIRPFIRELSRKGIEVFLPATRDSILHHGLFLGDADLVQGDFGVWEPASVSDGTPANLDLVFVPALAVDRRGNRLGYGLGYYDRFLSELKSTLIVPIFSKQVLGGIPNESHDVPVHILVTEQSVYHV